jgi:hypothetical protein
MSRIAAVGLFDFLRKDEKAIPEPGTPEFEATVQGSELPDSKGTETSWGSWSSVGDASSVEELHEQAGAEMKGSQQGSEAGDPASMVEVAKAMAQFFGGNVQMQQGGAPTLDLRGVQGLREAVKKTLREHGVDPESGEQIDASAVPGLSEALTEVLGRHGVNAPRGPITVSSSGSEQGGDQSARLAQLDQLEQSGAITDEEYQRQRNRILGGE